MLIEKRQYTDELKVESNYEENDYIFTSENEKTLNGRNMARTYERILKSPGIK